MELTIWAAMNNVFIMIGIMFLYYTYSINNRLFWLYFILLLFWGYLIFVFIYTFYPGNGSGNGMVLFTWTDLNQRLADNTDPLIAPGLTISNFVMQPWVIILTCFIIIIGWIFRQLTKTE